MKKIPFLLFFLHAFLFPCLAQEDELCPSWLTVGIQEEDGRSIKSDKSASPLVLDGSTTPLAEAVTAEIAALARGLEGDPQRIFAYVHERIRYEPYFGSKRGAQLTLFEGAGNDFDQAALLVALLRAAGYTASYQFATVSMPYESAEQPDFKTWLGLSLSSSDWNAAQDYLTNRILLMGGFPYFDDATANNLIFHRVWVKLTLGNDDYFLDPAYKSVVLDAGTNLLSAIGMSTNDIMSALTSGSTTTTNYVQNLNYGSLSNTLRGYATAFTSYLQSNCPNASVAQIVGGPRIASPLDSSLDTPLPFTVLSTGSNTTFLEWDNIPTNLMVRLTISFAGTNCTYLTPALQGGRLAIAFNAAGVGTLLFEEQTNLLVQTSSGSESVNVTTTMWQPFGSWDFANQTLSGGRSYSPGSAVAFIRTNSYYALVFGFRATKERLEQRQRVLDAYRHQGLADTNRFVICETLNIAGINFLLQTELAAEVLSAHLDMASYFPFRLGRMGQELHRGYYLDMFHQQAVFIPRAGGATNNLIQLFKMADLWSYFGSANEHGLIEQMQSSNLVAASTIKMLYRANETGSKIFLVSTNNWKVNATIRDQVINYGDNLGVVDAYVTSGYTMLLPKDGSQTAGQGTWTGLGFIAHRQSGYASTSLGFIISRGYSGGYSVWPDILLSPSYVWQSSYSQPNYFSSQPVFLPTITGADPVNMSDGSFTVEEPDLVVGDKEPRGLNLVRSYASGRRYHNLAGMAHGWTHNYAIALAEDSSPLAAWGDTVPAHMAPVLVASLAAVQLYNGANPEVKNWAATALITKWAMDQITKNSVSVRLGKDTVQFVRQAGGGFSAPANCTMSLVKTNTGYWLQERHGNLFKFDALGRATNILDQYNKGLTISYLSTTSSLPLTVTDWKGRALVFGYGGTTQRLTAVTNGTRVVVYNYNTNFSVQGDLTSVRDPESKTNAFFYDANHQLVASQNALGQLVVSNIYDAFGRVVTQYTQGDADKMWRLYYSGTETIEQDPAGNKRRFFYDDKSRLIGVLDALTNLSQTLYDGQDHVVMTISPSNEVTTYIYDGHHNMICAVDPLGCTNLYNYDAEDRLTSTVDARGNSQSFGYNSAFQVIATTNGVGDWVTLVYDSTDGLLTNRTDAAGATSYSYDAQGYLSKVIYPHNLGTNGFLNSTNGDLLSLTNARGYVTSFQYNARRQLTNTIATSNLTVKASFDAVGNQTSQTDALGFTTTSYWSATRKLLGTSFPSTPQGVPSTTNCYDRRDWLSSTVNNPSSGISASTLFTNDAAGRLVMMIDPLQRATTFGYDADGRRLSAVNAANETTTQTWDKRGRSVTITDAAQHTVGRACDGAGNLIFLTNRNGNVWRFQFDGANRLTNTISPQSRETRITYDGRGLVSTVEYPSTHAVTNYYDARGRLTNRLDAITNSLYGYDANNNRTATIEAGRSSRWSFDAYDRVTSFTNEDGYDIHYRSDANGNVTNLVYPGNHVVTYAYDALNRLTDVWDWRTTSNHTVLEYDLANRLKKITRPNGTVRELNYDAAGQVQNIWEKNPSGIPVAMFKFRWNDAGRLASEFAAPPPHVPSARTGTMTYDADNRLETFQGASMGAAQAVSLDNDGNMTWGPGTNDTYVSFIFNARHQLTTVPGTNAVPTLTYGYDALGNRSWVSVSNNIASFVINPNAALSQVLMRVRPGITNYYVYGLGLLYEITETASSSCTLTYHYDYRGSTVALTDAAGNIKERFEYSSYGSVTHRTSTNDTPFLFNGRYGVQTDANGLLYMRARYYNPYLCRFINPDPSGFAGGLNWYVYADGNPVSLLDPFGLGAVGDFGGGSWLQRAYSAIGNFLMGSVDYGDGSISYNSSAFSAGVESYHSAVQQETLRRDVGQAAVMAATALVPVGRVGEALLGGERGAAALELGASRALTTETTLSSDIAATFSGGKYATTVLQEDMLAYRYSGGVSESVGRFLTTGGTVNQISSPVSASLALNLPEGATAAQLNRFIIPTGTRIFTGRVAGGADSATQIFIRDSRVLIPH